MPVRPTPETTTRCVMWEYRHMELAVAKYMALTTGRLLVLSVCSVYVTVAFFYISWLFHISQR